jgi:hypothetical protein
MKQMARFGLIAGFLIGLLAATLILTGIFENQSLDVYAVSIHSQEGAAVETPAASSIPSSSLPITKPSVSVTNPSLGGSDPAAPISDTATATIQPSTPSPAPSTQTPHPATPTPRSTQPANPPQPIIQPEPSAQPEAPGTNAWLEKKIEAHRDEIDDTDLADFRNIITKLDQGYIQGMAADGFDTEEQDQLQIHLLERLGEAGYQRAKTLFIRYNYLLSEV